MNSQQTSHFLHVSLGIALSGRQSFFLHKLPQNLKRKVFALLQVCLSEVVNSVDVFKRTDQCFFYCLIFANGIRFHLEISLEHEDGFIVISDNFDCPVELLP